MNKKLLKSILCIASGVAIATSILFTTASCGSSSEKNNSLPESVYEIDQNNVLKGFKEGINLSQYDGICDAIQIPARITSVDNGAFTDYTNELRSKIPPYITKLTFEEGSNCSSIGNDAFANCSSLASVSFPSNLETIGQDAFLDCSSLASISLPSNLKSIDHATFMKCSALTSVDFSKATDLSIISSYAFYECSKLEIVNLSSCANLSLIGNNAFTSCLGLTSVSFPGNLKSIGVKAFNNCSNLSSITWDRWKGDTVLPDNPKSLPFLNISSIGTVKVTNPNEYDNINLLQLLVNNGGLPDTWLPPAELPEDAYWIENNVLKGFSTKFLENPSAYRLSNTMEIPARVTSIANQAFWDEDYGSIIPDFITKLTFAEGSQCSSIGEMGFTMSPFVSITLPDSLTGINQNAFEDCTSLTSVDFSKATNLSVIGAYAFSGCFADSDTNTSVSIDLSKCINLTTVSDNAFLECSSLTSVSLPSSLSVIGSNAFQKCKSLTSVSFPSSLSFINEHAFYECSKLEIVNLSSCANLTSIGESAFFGCLALTSVSLPSSLESISDTAFMFCNLSSVVLPKSLTTVGAQVFNHNVNLSSITWDAWNGETSLLWRDSFIGVCPTGGTVTVTNPIDDKHNTPELLNYLVEKCKLPESWRVLPNEVYDITDGVLKGFSTGFLENPSAYSKYTTMQIPANVTWIDDDAFYSTSTSTTTIPSFITRLTFAEGSQCTMIANGVFMDCSSLTSVDFSDATSLTFILECVFKNCSKLTSINFPSSLQSIGDYAFQNCSSLTSLSLPNKVSSIGYNTFQKCTALNSVDFSKATNLSSIGPSCFEMCSSLTSIDLSWCINLSVIDGYAFDYCTSLSSVTFPGSLTQINLFSFSFCSALKYIAWVLPNNYQDEITIGESAFTSISPSGKVESLNPWITSQEFLDWIKTKGDFPTTGWDVDN